ncbi:MAG TPA: hypothetical protein VI796_01385, partial [Candidatus Thermoplasmatota archaeon]|nr:hypothetical protein [Candidatus Thermoplasmatota archaeon]
ATQDVQVHLVAGETAAPGNYTLALVGTLAGVGEQRSEFNVTVPQVQRLVLEEDGATSLAIEPGAAVTFTFNVANLGNADDHAVLSATLSRNGWAAQLSATEVDVPAGEKVAVQLLLEAPANVAQGQSAQATVRLEGSPDEGLRFTGTVGGQFDPFLIAPSGIEIFPGNQTRFNLTVRNDGNAVDSFDLQLVGSLPSGWILGFENGQSTFVIRDIQPDESATTMATLRIPVTAALDEVRPIVIQAVSLGDRTAHHERTVLANVEAPPENGGGSGKDSPGLPLPLLLVAVVAALAMGRRRRES